MPDRIGVLVRHGYRRLATSLMGEPAIPAITSRVTAMLRTRDWELMGRRSVPPPLPAGLSTQPAHRRERPRSAPGEIRSAPFKGRSRLCAAGKVMSPVAARKRACFRAGERHGSRVECA